MIFRKSYQLYNRTIINDRKDRIITISEFRTSRKYYDIIKLVLSHVFENGKQLCSSVIKFQFDRVDPSNFVFANEKYLKKKMALPLGRLIW